MKTKTPRFAIDCPKCGGKVRINGGGAAGSAVRYCYCVECEFNFKYDGGEITEVGECAKRLPERGGLVVKPEPITPHPWRVRELLAEATTPAAKARLEAML